MVIYITLIYYFTDLLTISKPKLLSINLKSIAFGKRSKK